MKRCKRILTFDTCYQVETASTILAMVVFMVTALEVFAKILGSEIEERS